MGKWFSKHSHCFIGFAFPLVLSLLLSQQPWYQIRSNAKAEHLLKSSRNGNHLEDTSTQWDSCGALSIKRCLNVPGLPGRLVPEFCSAWGSPGPLWPSAIPQGAAHSLSPTPEQEQTHTDVLSLQVGAESNGSSKYQTAPVKPTSQLCKRLLWIQSWAEN